MTEPQRIPLWEKNIAANGEFEPFLEVYSPAGSEPRPGLLVIPGGGYLNLSAFEGRPVAERFMELGFQPAVLHYRRDPRFYPDPQLDALRAIQMMRLIGECGGIIPDKVAVMGFSAGGHLAASTGTLWDVIEVVANDAADAMNPRPDAMVLCYAVISAELQPDSFRHLTGGNPEQCKYLSLEHRVGDDTPPAFLWHTAEDKVVPLENALVFAEAMKNHGRPLEMHVFPEGHHGISLAGEFSARIWPELAAAFLKRVLA